MDRGHRRREDYVRTIHAWQQNFRAREPEISRLLTAEQVRVWRLYLAGGALAFADGRMGVHLPSMECTCRFGEGIVIPDRRWVE